MRVNTASFTVSRPGLFQSLAPIGAGRFTSVVARPRCESLRDEQQRLLPALYIAVVSAAIAEISRDHAAEETTVSGYTIP